MNRHHTIRKKRTNASLIVALLFPMLLTSIGGTVYANFIMSAQLICNTNITSGETVVEITGWAIETTNTIDANGNGIVEGDELKIESVTDGDGKIIALNITANPIFPDWYLNLTVDIHNTANSIPIRLSRTFQYFNDTLNEWVATDEAGLLNLFRIRYFDAWYNTTSGEPIPDITTHDLWPCNTVTILQSLTFDGQNYPDLQGQTYSFRVIITADPPE